MAFHLTRLPEMTAMVCAILEQREPVASERSVPASATDAAVGRSVSSLHPASRTTPDDSASSLVEAVHLLPDSDLETLLTQAAGGRAEFDRVITVAAGEAAKRSQRALGHGGLAQRRGHRTAVQLVQSLTGESKGEAARQVKVGELIGETDAVQRLATSTGVGSGSGSGSGSGDAATAEPGPSDDGRNNNGLDDEDPISGLPESERVLPWQHPVTAAIMTGALSTENGHVILRTLESVSDTCTGEALRDAAAELVAYATQQQECATLHEDLLRRARQVRDLVDPDGIEERFTKRYERRSVKTWHDRDGALNLHAVCDDESGTFLTQLFDLALSPRRGGPRFVAKDDLGWAQTMMDDPHSNEQLAFDTLLDVLHAGAACDHSTTFRTDRPAVRVITVVDTHEADGEPRATTEGDGSSLTGHAGQLEGSAFAVPSTFVATTACTDGVVPITVDRTGRALNLGRSRRGFSPAQRIVLRARDGGCLWPGCDRPPWQTEAHHIEEWDADHGRTDIADGVLLCKFHHLNLHNNHWRIRRNGTDYELIPPPETGAAPIPLHPKNTTWEHVRQRTG